MCGIAYRADRSALIRFSMTCSRCASGAELGSAFRSAAGKDLAAVRGLHSLAEAVLFLALELLGLIGTKHGVHSFLRVSQVPV